MSGEDEESEPVNEELAALQARARERDGLEGQIVFKGDFESHSSGE